MGVFVVKTDANEGLSKVIWISVITLVVLAALGAVMWWYDEYLIHHG